MLELIVHYTNLHGEQYNDSQALLGLAFDQWTRTDQIEMRSFFGLLFLSGVLRASREPISSLWNEEEVFQRSIFPATMSRNRFLQILRFIRFDDKSSRAIRLETDKLAAISEVSNMINIRLRQCYYPSESLTVDEQLVRFFGRCPFRMYMPSKPAKYGIKFWILCDSANGYCLNFQVYTGRAIGAPPEKHQGQRVVLELTEHLEGGYNITVDNFFTSVQLAESLLRRPNPLTLVGTLRRNKPEIPTPFLSTRNRQLHSSLFCFDRSMTLVSYLAKQSKCVVLLSTFHHDATVLNEENENRPEIIDYYNRTKVGVDLMDQKLSYYRTGRGTRRWTLALFLNLLDICAHNAYIVWRDLHPEWQANRNDKRRVFLLDLGKSLVMPQIRERDRAGLHRPILRAIAAATGQFDPPAPEAAAALSPRARCEICGRSRDKKTKLRCALCRRMVCKMHSTNRVEVVCQLCAAADEAVEPIDEEI